MIDLNDDLLILCLECLCRLDRLGGRLFRLGGGCGNRHFYRLLILRLVIGAAMALNELLRTLATRTRLSTLALKNLGYLLGSLLAQSFGLALLLFLFAQLCGADALFLFAAKLISVILGVFKGGELFGGDRLSDALFLGTLLFGGLNSRSFGILGALAALLLIGAASLGIGGCTADIAYRLPKLFRDASALCLSGLDNSLGLGGVSLLDGGDLDSSLLCYLYDSRLLRGSCLFGYGFLGGYLLFGGYLLGLFFFNCGRLFCLCCRLFRLCYRLFCLCRRLFCLCCGLFRLCYRLFGRFLDSRLGDLCHFLCYILCRLDNLGGHFFIFGYCGCVLDDRIFGGLLLGQSVTVFRNHFFVCHHCIPLSFSL